MGLCLHVFGDCASEDEDPEEIAECDLGPYANFDHFRATVARHLDASRYPVLMEHSNSEGEWVLGEIPALERELREIATAFKKLPPEESSGFADDIEGNANAESLYDCFHSCEGENLFEALIELGRIARQHRRPITFM